MRAVIAVAGMGSRFFPIGKTINKCMLPILNQPVVAYAVADCVAAGARDIAIVTAPGEPGRQVRHYFSEDRGLKDYFTARGWQDKYAAVADLHTQATFTFLEQPRDDRYGTALPAIVAADFIAGDDFLLVAGDDLLLRSDGGSDLADLSAARTAAAAPAALAAATVPGTEAHRYGILHPRAAAGHQLLDELLEKPNNYGEPTAYINISRTLLPAHALAYFQKLTPAPNGEYQATDAVIAFARDHDVLIHPVAGDYHDCGNPAGWLAANNAAAQSGALAG
ncbi:sugar phosphate nucleotidyltransferase [Micromonospora carbonacea]|uniref:UTP--glucose-1-phosphate uridylyltransferase n=1 Tax=Micromonospora carbonacea TaxID=47853 RepID=A0A1C5AK64_9ACTN|nr:sugar phosphate nucleotidyltransferase [Micromonospora carbonacea]SCF45394.1 UTP--glucose-1-phosphate uridylyltransferase [Micromonospora carbonacea]